MTTSKIIEDIIAEKKYTFNDIYWLEMEKDCYRDDKEKSDIIQNIINEIKERYEISR
jgi:hypothetical protein